jgi:hypothetical protein
VTPGPGAAPLLDEQAESLVAAGFREMGYGAPVSLADVALRVLEPLVTALVAERVRLARIDERLKCAAACDRLGVPDVARVIRDSAA